MEIGKNLIAQEFHVISSSGNWLVFLQNRKKTGERLELYVRFLFITIYRCSSTSHVLCGLLHEGESRHQSVHWFLDRMMDTDHAPQLAHGTSWSKSATTGHATGVSANKAINNSFNRYIWGDRFSYKGQVWRFTDRCYLSSWQSH